MSLRRSKSNPKAPSTSTRQPALRIPAIIAAVAVISTLVVGVASLPRVPGLPALPGASPAMAQTPVKRLCSGSDVSTSLSPSSGDTSYVMKVPVGATLVLSGTADLLSPSIHGWETAVGISPVNPAGYLIGNRDPVPQYNVPFGSSWVNYGPATELTFTVHEYYGASVNVWFTVLITGGSNDPLCKPLTAEETLGNNCAEPNSGGVQGSAADPVNTATGNFHQPFVDFVVPGRGPGLSLSHAYCDDAPVMVAARV